MIMNCGNLDAVCRENDECYCGSIGTAEEKHIQSTLEPYVLRDTTLDFSNQFIHSFIHSHVRDELFSCVCPAYNRIEDYIHSYILAYCHPLCTRMYAFIHECNTLCMAMMYPNISQNPGESPFRHFCVLRSHT